MLQDNRFPMSFFRAVGMMTIHPILFFEGLKEFLNNSAVEYGKLVRSMICLLVLSFLVQIVQSQQMQMPGLKGFMTILIVLMVLVLICAFMVGMIFLMSWCWQLVLSYLGGRGEYQGTFGVLAYCFIYMFAVGALALLFPPLVIGNLWATFLGLQGLSIIHQVSKWKVSLACLIAGLIWLLVAAVAGFVVVGVAGLGMKAGGAKVLKKIQKSINFDSLKKAEDSPAADQSMNFEPGIPLNIKTISKNGEETELLAVEGHVTIFDFYADWCPPCRVFSPQIEQYVRDNDLVVLRKINIVNWGSPVAKQYFINSIPSVWVAGPDGRLLEKYLPGNVQLIHEVVQMALSQNAEQPAELSEQAQRQSSSKVERPNDAPLQELEEEFYDNGELKSQIVYKRGKKIKESHYDEQGEMISMTRYNRKGEIVGHISS